MLTFGSTLAGEQAGRNLKIRIDPDSRLLTKILSSDLRKTTIHPQYRAGVYRCDLYLEEKSPGQPRMRSAQLTFGDPKDLKQFQRYVTGYKVHVEL
jgi:hypothetical protein